ncbi:MAG: FkbM family methyltransferase [Bacteroidia bacterium]
MKIASFFFNKLAALAFRSYQSLHSIALKIHKPVLSVCERNKIKWYAVNGDHTLRVGYSLNQDAVVYDIGGYEGDWAAEIAARYACPIYIFEPVSSFVEVIRKRFSENKKIHLLPYGLGGNDGELMIAALAEASSVYRDENNYSHKAEEKEKISIRAVDKVMAELKTRTIDLMKINIEGGEYELLECLLDKGLIGNISNLQIQFHDFIPDAEKRMNAIKARLALTHELTYEYVFVWENWKKKGM